MSTQSPMRVIVAGGGIAGLEALLALRELAGDRAELTLLSPGDAFVYRPFSVAQPFGLGHAERIPLAKVAGDTGARWERAALAGVDDAAGTARTEEGEEISFDALLVATGATPVVGVEQATTWWPGGDPEVLSGLLRDLEEGYVQRVAFVVPPGYVWPLPAYELALMTAREARGMGQDKLEITLITPEREPLALFGEVASAALREELERADVRLLAGAAADVRRAGSGLEIRAGDGEPLVVQRAIAVPRVVGPAIPGLPADEEGFVLTEDDGRVQGHERTWAAGDGVASPIKLGGLATWQAGRAAAAIAQLAGAGPAAPGEDAPVLEGVLMTGAEPRPLDGSGARGRREHVPLWHPAGKVAGRWLPRYIGDEAPEEERAAPEAAVRVERSAAEVRRVDSGLLYDLSHPLSASSPEIRRLGRHMHGHH